MPNLTLIETEPAAGAAQARMLPPSTRPLNLLLEMPNEGTRWRNIFVCSLATHIALFTLAIQLPSFIPLDRPEHTVIVRRTPLYVPRDIFTQKEPNRQKPSKKIDLADLLASKAAPERKAFTPPSRKPLQPQILAQAPKIEVAPPVTPAPTALPPGSATGLTAPPPPAPPPNPFQSVGSETATKTPQKLAVPKPTVQSAISELAHDRNAHKPAVNDDDMTPPTPRFPGSQGQPAVQRMKSELESDPQGADFKPYLTEILRIVRANWQRVIPESVRMGTLRGRTVIEFTINRDGSIPHLATATPSGSEPLDRAAVAGLSMSNPLPPLPSDFKGLSARIAFTFSYNMPSE